MESKELRDFLPLMDIEDGCVLSKRGDLTFGWRVVLPVAYTVNEEGYDSIIASFMQAYRLLPPYCIVHKQDVYRYDSYVPEEMPGFLARSGEEHFRGRKYLNGYSYIFLTFSNKSNVESYSGGGSYFHAFSGVSLDPSSVERLRSVALQFESVLSNNSLLSMRMLDADDYLHMGAGGKDEGVIADYLQLFSSSDEPDYGLDFYPDHIECGDNVMRAWYVEDSDCYDSRVRSVMMVGDMSSGSSQVFLSGGSPIGYSLRIPHVVNRYVVTLPRKSVEKELDRRRRLMNSFSLYSASCRVDGAELEKYLLDSAMNALTTVKCFTSVLAWGGADSMQDVTNRVVTAFSDMGVAMCEERRLAPSLYYAGIPGAASELGYDYYMTGELTAFLCHGLWDGYDAGMKGGSLRFVDRRRMVPVPLDIQSVARSLGYIDNMNAIVVGPSGTGKSFTMNHIVRCMYDSGDHVVVIDVGQSYRGLCSVISEETAGRDGLYCAYDPAHPLSFNPFRAHRQWNSSFDEDGQRSDMGLDFVISVLEVIYTPDGGWQGQKSDYLQAFVTRFLEIWDSGWDVELEEALKQAYVNERRRRSERNGEDFDRTIALRGWRCPLSEIFREGRGEDPVFDDFYRFVCYVVQPLVMDGNYVKGSIVIDESMFRVKDFASAMEKFSASGIYSFLLNDRSDSDIFRSRFIVFEVDTIKDNKELFPLWMLCIMRSFQSKMRTLEGRKVLVIEEAWSAVAKPEMAEFIAWMWRTARKFSTSAVVVTQMLSDLVSSEIIRDSIVQNSSVKILLDQSRNSNDFASSASILALTPKDVSLALSVNRSLDPRYLYKEVFISVGDHYSNVFGLEVSKEEAVVYESEFERKRLLYEEAERLGSFLDAVRSFVSDFDCGRRDRRTWKLVNA